MFTSTPMESRSSTVRTSRRSGASPSGVSPTRLTRLQEKEDLRQLNDRLANYIERVRQLENDKSSLQLLLEEKEEVTLREVASVRRLYETELADARKTLDATASERAKIQIELTQLQEDHRKLTARSRVLFLNLIIMFKHNYTCVSKRVIQKLAFIKRLWSSDGVFEASGDFYLIS